ncbi:hypothetical protein DIPPA_31345 [Diplonema papillatum]|nr:hypothetical protein DIPPA_31345 [Diplonema papillatum]
MVELVGECQRCRSPLLLLLLLMASAFFAPAHGVTTVWRGYFEEELYEDIQFWTSTTKYSAPAWADLCADVEHDGRRGRLARLYTEEEHERARAQSIRFFSDLGLGGTDIWSGGLWLWSDGSTFWERNTGCSQKFCNWAVGQPDGKYYYNPDTQLLLGRREEETVPQAGLWWKDVGATYAASSAFCEFPCASDADCKDKVDNPADPRICHRTTGRCVRVSECSKYSLQGPDDGFLESTPGNDITFWLSSIAVQLPSAENACKLMCKNGRTGRLARILSIEENKRITDLANTSSYTGYAYVDGTDIEKPSTWKYSDGRVFFQKSTCKQGYCNWMFGEPTNRFSEQYFAISFGADGGWLDTERDGEAQRYVCEFPCYSDEDCEENYMCHKHGRCVKKSECSVYGSLKLDADGKLDNGTRKDIRLWYSGDLKASREDAQSMCEDLCVDGRYGRLFELHTREEDIHVKDLIGATDALDAFVGSTGLYMGGYKDGDGVYRWSSGQMFSHKSARIPCRQPFCHWASGQPLTGTSRNYILLNTISEWMSSDGKTQRPWLCEFPCTSDDDCESGYTCLPTGRCVEAKGATCLYGMQTYSDGVQEAQAHEDVRFWVSNRTYTWSERSDVCRDLCYDGRQGRLARVHSQEEMDRMQALLSTAGVAQAGLSGDDSGLEGTWRWTDGPVFYTASEGCQQKFCKFSPNQPDNLNGNEHALELEAVGGYADGLETNLRVAICEFPCWSNDDCGANYVCHYTGRCVLRSHCNPEGTVSIADGILEDDAGVSIQFWHSDELRLSYSEASATCKSLCLDGRHGRLARILSADENQRASTVAQQQRSFIDGTFVAEGSDVYQWSDGSIIFKLGQGCEQGYCMWTPNHPTGLDAMALDTTWVDVNGTIPLLFTCEFACIGDADCNEGDDPCPTYECTQHGRCVLNPVCFRDGACSSFRAETECTAKDTCEWDQTVGAKGTCVDAPCQYADETTCLTYAACEWNQDCSDVSDHKCVQKRCTAIQSDACTADPRCLWSGSACALASCVQFPSEKCCGAENGCHWNTEASPAFCKMTYCAATYADQAGCSADLQCMWHGDTCLEVQCPLLDECNCKAHDMCLWDANGMCASAVFTDCPALDIVVLLDGSSSMVDSFGRHPHGFYALANHLRDWVQRLPLSGEKAGEVPAAGSTATGFRVGFVQFAGGLRQVPVWRTTAASAVGAKGSLSGSLAELEADITWHEQNFIGGSVLIEGGLIAANDMFGTADHGRTRILFVFVDDDIPDASASIVTELTGKNVEIFGIAVRRFESKTTDDLHAEASLGRIVTAPAADHLLNLQIDELKSSFLFDMCNPLSPFGSIIVSKTDEPVQMGIHQACPLYTGSHNCTQDLGCTWHSVDHECVNSACVRLCTKAECQAANLCGWTDEGWCMKEAVCAFTSEALCVGSTHLCDWKDGACEKAPCVSVGTEQECMADDKDCTWWTINGTAKCIVTPCTSTNGALCAQETECQWATDPCNTTAGPVCQLAGCSAYTVASECNSDPRCSTSTTQCQLKPCAVHASELCCDKVTECGWDVSTSPATCQLKTCYTFTQPASCGANLECMWSLSESRCVDLACAEFSDECSCGQMESCFWKKGVPGLCTFSRYGMCPAMDVVVVFDGSARSAETYGRHPDGFIGVLSRLQEWAQGLPLSGESYIVGDASSLATSAVRLSFLQFRSDNGAASVVAGKATNGHLSGNWTELREDLAWHMNNPSGGTPMMAAALSRAATVFEAGSPSSTLRKRLLFIITTGDIDTTGSKAYLDELDGLEVQRFGLLVQKADTQSKPDVAAEITLRTLTSAAQSLHTEGTTIDTMLVLLNQICNPSAGWGSDILEQETPGKVTGRRYPCEMYHLGTACAKDPGCVWSDSSSVCVNSPCLDVCNEGDCRLVTPTNCTWAGTVCIDAPVLDCHCKYDGGDVDHNMYLCDADEACSWNATGSSCMIDECRSRAEGNTTCGNNRQKCIDPSWEPCSNDWYCDCIAPAVASSYGALAVAECEVYECASACPTCENGACGSEQICNDPDTSANSLGDWECVCQSPYTGVGSAKAANCKIDECLKECQHCENGTCNGYINQECVDPDVSTRSDWECHCPFPTGISAVGQQADCDFDECTMYNETCSLADQYCIDDNIVTLNNWECACKAPATGRGNMAVAPVCYIDECAANCTTCANGACHMGVVNQTCFDNNTRSTSLNDWMCTCPEGSPSSLAKLAVCELDECAGSCPTCANTTCSSWNQSCTDSSRLSNSLSDWRCECLYPSNATSPLSAVPSCDRDECELYASACTNADPAQLCVDPDESIAGDWSCKCIPPSTGNQTAGAAECSIDECEASCITCEEDACNLGPLNQTCEDLDMSARSLSDWVCACPWSHASVNQSATSGQAANCVFDECLDSCPSCAAGLCEASGQTCVDPNKRTYSLNDWMCTCPAPSRAFNVSAAVLSCEFDECEDHGNVCSDAEQDCVDLNTGSGGHDWVCRCRLPTLGTATKGPAACLLDECTANCATCANDTCTTPNPVQLCTDPNPSADSLSDWTCTCPFPSTKSALGKAANCPFNECDRTCSTCANTTCTGANQTCSDPNPTSLSVLDWICTCPLPSTTASVARRVASCDFDECTLHNSTCTAAGQMCDDPDLSVADDWQCQCSLHLRKTWLPENPRRADWTSVRSRATRAKTGSAPGVRLCKVARIRTQARCLCLIGCATAPRRRRSSPSTMQRAVRSTSAHKSAPPARTAPAQPPGKHASIGFLRPAA